MLHISEGRVLRATIAVLLAFGIVGAAPREKLSDAWWTGPMLAPSAATLPRGHVLVEPYLYDVIQYGAYNREGALGASSHSNTFGSLTYFIYGLTDRLNVGVIPTFGFATTSNAPSSSGVGFGDVALLAQYRIAQYRVGSWVPMTSINVQQSFPTGTYDRLGKNPNDGFGTGAHTTTLSLYTQSYFWMRNGRILRARFNASQAFSSSASVDGVSVYGTGAGFHGSAKPGNAFTFDVAGEYSITRKWVFALDAVYHHAASTQVIGVNSVTNSGPSDAYELAPALEYNWSPNVGVLFGLRVIPAGFNTSATVTPAFAINIVH